MQRSASNSRRTLMQFMEDRNMDSSFLLNDPELIELTGYQKPACQLRILKTMGINAQKKCPWQSGRRT